MKNLIHSTLLLYKGKETRIYVESFPFIVVDATIVSRDNEQSTVLWKETIRGITYQPKFGNINEFQQYLITEFDYILGHIKDDGDFIKTQINSPYFQRI
jgi:hypothetical protein